MSGLEENFRIDQELETIRRGIRLVLELDLIAVSYGILSLASRLHQISVTISSRGGYYGRRRKHFELSFYEV
jgi:hypothetical protein